MKQIIVNVSGLSVEEKQRVNEALAKITGTHKLPVINPAAAWFLASALPSDSMIVVWGTESLIEKPTHTPQQVLEMAGMAGMAEKRKVRADFDPKQPISVDVSSCTHREKCEVQQAFFDVGIVWPESGTDFKCLSAKSYSNSTSDGSYYDHLMYGIPRTESITPQQFLAMVYEPEQKSHPHADLMALYAEDAKTTDKPWELWQIKCARGEWRDLTCNPSFAPHLGYRRKPKTHIVNGVEVPDLRFVPCDDQYFYKPEPYARALVAMTTLTRKSRSGEDMIRHNLCYEYTEEGKQAAILHAKAWLGIA